MQSSWAIGEMIAAAVTLVVLPRFGWRAVFFVGVLPALVVLWIRREVPESPIWLERGNPQRRFSRRDVAAGHPREGRRGDAHERLRDVRLLGPLHLDPGVPRPARGPGRPRPRHRRLPRPGCSSWRRASGWATPSSASPPTPFGRRRSYVVYLLAAAALVPVFGSTQSLAWLLVLGPFVGFFGTGFFSGFSAVASELFPTEIRATAMGLTYNIGRGLLRPRPVRGRLGRDAALLLRRVPARWPPLSSWPPPWPFCFPRRRASTSNEPLDPVAGTLRPAPPGPPSERGASEDGRAGPRAARRGVRGDRGRPGRGVARLEQGTVEPRAREPRLRVPPSLRRAAGEVRRIRERPPAGRPRPRAPPDVLADVPRDVPGLRPDAHDRGGDGGEHRQALDGVGARGRPRALPPAAVLRSRVLGGERGPRPGRGRPDGHVDAQLPLPLRVDERVLRVAIEGPRPARGRAGPGAASRA